MPSGRAYEHDEIILNDEQKNFLYGQIEELGKKFSGKITVQRSAELKKFQVAKFDGRQARRMIFAWLENKIPRVSFVKKRMNNDLLIICADNLTIYYLNSTAAFFIELADGKLTVSDIKQKFLARYDVDKCELERDFVEMIRDLQWKKF